MVAEGGTGVNHAVMVASSDKITGPYVPNERNPILTSRNLSYDNWVHSTGHADLFQLPDGRWYMVCLGIRGDAGPSMDRRSNMGRETFLVRVSWEREPMEWSPLGPPMRHLWPVAAPHSGRVERTQPVPLKGTEQKISYTLTFYDSFYSDTLHPEWNFRRVPRPGTFSLTARPGCLRLFARPEVIKERAACSLMGVRQRESDFEFEARMEFTLPSDCCHVEAGISLFQKDDNYLNCTVRRDAADNSWTLFLKLAEPEKQVRCVRDVKLRGYAGHLRFAVRADATGYCFRYSLDDGKSFKDLATTPPDLIISKGYTGAYLGVYCTSNGVPSGDSPYFADIDWIKSRAFQRE
mmetsp:Transcript_167647/g.533088  ORF Transcript_167647/g.533088 Transcript_167647/m.533088 type:complete len:350 (-) Transcript_167647:250-1299(-)